MYSVISFDGHTLNDADYGATALNFGTERSASVEWGMLAMGEPRYAGTWAREVNSLAVGLVIKKQGTAREALEAQLRAWFRPGTEGTLVAALGDGASYQVSAVVQSLTMVDRHPGRFTAILQSGEHTWRAVTAATASWTADAAHLTKTITVGGTEPTRLKLTIASGGTVVDGWKYQQLAQVTPPARMRWGRRPMCITMDTAALVTASQMQADCDDLRVMVGAEEVRRWIGNPNHASSRIWFYMDLPAGEGLKLRTAVASSGAVGELAFELTVDSKRALQNLPAGGFLLAHGGEWFQCAGVDLRTLRVGVTSRGALGTTLAGHNVGDTMSYVPAPVYVLWGNAAAGDPADEDGDYNDEQPVFDLAASDNTQWVYTATTGFYDAANPGRGGSWVPSVTRVGDLSKTYLYAQDAASGTPAMGMEMSTWQKAGKWKGETALIAWGLPPNVGGLLEVSSTGAKYRSGTAFPTTAALQVSTNGTTWKTLWTEASPVSAASWSAWTHAAQAVAAGYPYVRFALLPSLAGGSELYADFEVLTATVKFITGALPTVALLTGVDNYPLNVMLSVGTGEVMYLSYPMRSTKTLVVDGEAYTVTYDGVNAHGALRLDDEARDVWLPIVPGDNVLTVGPVVTGDDIGTLTIGLSWYARRAS